MQARTVASTLSAAARSEELQNRDLVGGVIQAVLWFWLATSC